jgi:hypothetical protein
LAATSLTAKKIYGQFHYQNRVLCRVSKTLGKGHFTLGKVFNKCYTRQTFYWQMVLCRVFFRTLAKDFAERRITLGKEKALAKLRIAKKPKNSTTFFKLCEQLSNHY